MLTQMYQRIEEEARSIVENYDTLEDAEDSIYEQADYLVPRMDRDVIEEWMEISIYDAEDYCGSYNIIIQMQAALMEWYVNGLRECVEALFAERGEE